MDVLLGRLAVLCFALLNSADADGPGDIFDLLKIGSTRTPQTLLPGFKMNSGDSKMPVMPVFLGSPPTGEGAHPGHKVVPVLIPGYAVMQSIPEANTTTTQRQTVPTVKTTIKTPPNLPQTRPTPTKHAPFIPHFVPLPPFGSNSEAGYPKYPPDQGMSFYIPPSALPPFLVPLNNLLTTKRTSSTKDPYFFLTTKSLPSTELYTLTTTTESSTTSGSSTSDKDWPYPYAPETLIGAAGAGSYLGGKGSNAPRPGQFPYILPYFVGAKNGSNEMPALLAFYLPASAAGTVLQNGLPRAPCTPDFAPTSISPATVLVDKLKTEASKRSSVAELISTLKSSTEAVVSSKWTEKSGSETTEPHVTERTSETAGGLTFTKVRVSTTLGGPIENLTFPSLFEETSSILPQSLRSENSTLLEFRRMEAFDLNDFNASKANATANKSATTNWAGTTITSSLNDMSINSENTTETQFTLAAQERKETVLPVSRHGVASSMDVETTTLSNSDNAALNSFNIDSIDIGAV